MVIKVSKESIENPRGGQTPGDPGEESPGGGTPGDVDAQPGNGELGRDAGLAPEDGAPTPPRDRPAEPPAPACGACTRYAPPRLLASVGTPALIELSGAAISRKHGDVIFVHNDGPRADFYALTAAGAPMGRFVLSDADVVDMEDAGLGPCPDGSCLYLADIGDNAAERSGVVIFRVREPDIIPGLLADDIAVPFETFPVVYEDGPHNAEGVLIDPSTGVVYIVTKPPRGQPSAVYRLPHPLAAMEVNTATKVATLPIPAPTDRQATGAAAHPCGRGFLVRTYNTLYEFRIPAGTPFEQAFTVAPVQIATEVELQSEAVSYWPDGRGFITSGEQLATPIYTSGCAP